MMLLLYHDFNLLDSDEVIVSIKSHAIHSSGGGGGCMLLSLPL